MVLFFFPRYYKLYLFHNHFYRYLITGIKIPMNIHKWGSGASITMVKHVHLYLKNMDLLWFTTLICWAICVVQLFNLHTSQSCSKHGRPTCRKSSQAPRDQWLKWLKLCKVGWGLKFGLMGKPNATIPKTTMFIAGINHTPYSKSRPLYFLNDLYKPNCILLIYPLVN